MASIFRNLFSKASPEASPDPEMAESNVRDYSPTAHRPTITTGIPSMSSTTPSMSFTTTTGNSPEYPAFEVNHVRANMQQRWVSEDFMPYVDPSLSETQIQSSIRRLMPQAYIKGMWPPDKATPIVVAKLTFVAVAFESLYLLFDNDCERWETPVAKKVKRDTKQKQIDAFVTDMEYMHANNGKQQDGNMLTVLVTDAKKTKSQVRYERDVRERVTKGNQYYALKKARGATYCTRNAKRASLPTPKCEECGKPSDNHWMW